MTSRFNIRIYALLLNPEKNQILVTDEIRFNQSFTKFPGGGLEFGEGISEGLAREWMEETGLSLENPKLFYLNDFFQVSAFNPKDQIISVYYLISCPDISRLPTKNQRFDFETFVEGAQIFRWVDLQALPEQLNFPIDQVVARKLQFHFLEN